LRVGHGQRRNVGVGSGLVAGVAASPMAMHGGISREIFCAAEVDE
jgi:hypothetical protein